MSTSRKKVAKIVNLITEGFGLKEINVFVKKIDVKSEINKRIAEIDDSELEHLIDGIKAIVNED
jgi:hypothetical protein